MINPRLRALPKATVAIAVTTVAAYLLVAALGRANEAATLGGFIPARVGGLTVAGGLPWPLTPLSATLLHGGLLHLGINLLSLVYCGKEDETALGASGTALVYVAGAYAAAGAQYIADPASAVPMIGASGAVSAFVGAYAMLYGRRRANPALHPEVALWLHIAWLAAAWVVLQILLGIASRAGGIAIATAAHVGGFLIGVLLARPLLRWRYRNA